MTQTEQALEALARELLGGSAETIHKWGAWNRGVPVAQRAVILDKLSVEFEAASAALSLLAERMRGTAELLLEDVEN